LQASNSLFQTAQLIYVRKQSFFLFSSILFSFFLIASGCKKINEATTLGGDLIPPVDNINTFEALLEAKTKTVLYNDSTKLTYGEQVALGHLNDPEFGETTADVYFNISRQSYRNDPFPVKTVADSLYIDSVVLSLSYTGAYGDSNSLQTVRVYEIEQSSLFTDTALFKFTDPEFITTGTELGSKTYTIKNLKDSVRHVFALKDTSRLANLLRIPLDVSFGYRLASYDTMNTSNGGYRNDSIFKKLFKGFAIKSESDGNGLAYFNLADGNKTKLTIYSHKQVNGVKDTSVTEFFHITNGQANLINRQISGGYQNSLANGVDDKIYIESTPGSYGAIKIQGLDTFKNSVIHRAELIVSKLSSTSENTFTVPSRLYLDRKRINNDSAFFFSKDLFDASGNLNGLFGGTLGSDEKYRFNITRYVQDVITGREKNDSLRLFAPLQVIYKIPNGSSSFTVPVPGIGQVANGRVVVAGGNYTADPALNLRLRIIYSSIK
jgi:hypothetical protein